MLRRKRELEAEAMASIARVEGAVEVAAGRLAEALRGKVGRLEGVLAAGGGTEVGTRKE